MIEISAVPAVASFSALALAISTLYLLVSELGGNLASHIKIARKKKSHIPFEPGRFIQQEARYIGRHLRRHETATLIFCASFASLLAIGRQDWLPEWPSWAWLVLTAVIATFFAYVQFRFCKLAIYRRKLDSLRDDHVIVADRLNEARARGYLVFHSIPMREGVIDHVVVGRKGIFAIQIIRPPSKKFTSVRLKREMLIFAPQDTKRGIKHIRKFTKPIKILSQLLSHAAGTEINIVPIIVVTNCDVISSSTSKCLLARPSNCIMFVGWTDTSTHLMGDDISKIKAWLEERCREMPFRKWRLRAPGGDIGYA